MAIQVIAEVGVNHNGCIETAFQMVKAAKNAGADIVKFQLFKADNLVRKDAPLAKYQEHNVGKNLNQYDMLKSLELSYEEHIKLSAFCTEIGIKYLSTAFDSESLKFLHNKVNQERFKIPSGEINNAPFLAEHANTGKELIISTGMSTLADIEKALSVIYYFRNTTDPKNLNQEIINQSHSIFSQKKALPEFITLLHCTTEYPAPMESINLRSMQTIGAAFDLPYGYSDHTEGIEISVAAAAMGASIIEKHFTLDKTANGPDHLASITPDELQLLVNSVRNVEAAMGSPLKIPSKIELDNAKVARKSLVALKDISCGDTFSEENLSIIRPGTGMSPMNYWDLIGRKATKDYIKSDFIDE